MFSEPREPFESSYRPTEFPPWTPLLHSWRGPTGSRGSLDSPFPFQLLSEACVGLLTLLGRWVSTQCLEYRNGSSVGLLPPSSIEPSKMKACQASNHGPGSSNTCTNTEPNKSPWFRHLLMIFYKATIMNQ